MSVANVSGFTQNEILSAKKISATGFATEYMFVQSSSRDNPASSTDLTGKLYVIRGYRSGSLGESGSLGDASTLSQSYEPGQVIVSTGRIGTGFIRLNANPNDTSTPFIDIVERTGTGIYDVELKTRIDAEFTGSYDKAIFYLQPRLAKKEGIDEGGNNIISAVVVLKFSVYA